MKFGRLIWFENLNILIWMIELPFTKSKTTVAAFIALVSNVSISCIYGIYFLCVVLCVYKDSVIIAAGFSYGGHRSKIKKCERKTNQVCSLCSWWLQYEVYLQSSKHSLFSSIIVEAPVVCACKFNNFFFHLRIFFSSLFHLNPSFKVFDSWRNNKQHNPRVEKKNQSHKRREKKSFRQI